MFYADTSELQLLTQHAMDAPEAIQGAKKSALSSAGFYITDEFRSFMRTEGQGTWPEPHDLSKNFRKFSDFGAGGSLVRKDQDEKSQFAKMEKLFKYIIKNNRVQTGFSFNINTLSPKLEALAARIAQGYDIQVKGNMRNLFAAVGFPLKATTKTLTVEPRSFEPVLISVEKELFDIFILKFEASLARKNPLFLG